MHWGTSIRCTPLLAKALEGLLCARGAEIPGIRRREEEISDGDQKEEVGHGCEEGVQGAGDDVKRDPKQQQPASPVAALEQKDSGHDGDDLQKSNQYHPTVKRTSNQMKDKGSYADENEQVTEEYYGKRAFHDFARFTSGSLKAV